MRGLVVGYGYKKWGNMRCFDNLIVVSTYIIYNIFYCMVERFPLNHGCRHG